MSTTTPTSTIADPHAPRDPAACERLAIILGRPMPSDWMDSTAVAARQRRLSEAAHAAGTAAVEVALACLEEPPSGSSQSALGPRCAEASIAFSSAALALLDARRTYVGTTQRSDAETIIFDALTDAAGATLATWVTGVMEATLRQVRAMM